MSNTPFTFLLKHSFLWLIGWFSLSLVEVILSLTINPFTIKLMPLFTILIYSFIGVTLGLFFAMINILTLRILGALKKPDSLIHFSMATCIATIFFLYSLLFFIKVGLYFNSSSAIFKSIILFFLSIVMLFVLQFFFRWMNRKGTLLISYLSLMPSLWIVLSLKLNRNKLLLPPILQITTLRRLILLIFGSVICFFLVYLLLSLSKRFLKRWGSIPLMKLSLITLPLLLLFLLIVSTVGKEYYKGIKKVNKNAPKDKPNVLLITLDTTRADHCSCYGYERLITPNLDRLSLEGVLFKNAYSTDSWTLPSHASIFTGMYPSQHGAHYNSEAIVRYFYEAQAGKKIDLEKIFWNCNASLSKENYTLAEALSEKGYRTAGVVGGIYCSPGFGLAQGFDYYDFTVFDASSDIKFFLISQVVGLFYPLNDFFTQYGYSGAKRIADHLNKVAFRWLEENCEQPFFLFINYFDPHRPYLPPHPYDEYFGKIDKGIIVNRNPKGDLSYITAEENLSNAVINGDYRLTPQEKELIISRYDGEIRYLDHCLGLLFEKLKALKIYDNTLIIVTSDHGEAFGEHNLMYHGKTLYEELLRVPLIIKYPSTSSLREVVEKRVSLVDLFPTILSFLNYPVPPGISGGNLKDSDHPILAENYLSSWVVDKRSKRFLRNLKVIYQGNMKYIWASNSLHELYDLEKDPREEENLIAKFPHKAEVMQKALTQWLVSLKPPKTEREKVKIGKETVERLRALGYVR